MQDHSALDESGLDSMGFMGFILMFKSISVAHQ